MREMPKLIGVLYMKNTQCWIKTVPPEKETVDFSLNNVIYVVEYIPTSTPNDRH